MYFWYAMETVVKYVCDDSGRKEAVILPIREYEKLMDKLDELDAIKEYDRAKTKEMTFRPLNQVMEDVGKYRKKSK